jgi:hypothetical protein
MQEFEYPGRTGSGSIDLGYPDVGINDQQEGRNGVQKLVQEIRALK